MEPQSIHEYILKSGYVAVELGMGSSSVRVLSND